MERNQKEILGVMMKQVGLDRSSNVAALCLLVWGLCGALKEEEKGKRGRERGYCRVKAG